MPRLHSNVGNLLTLGFFATTLLLNAQTSDDLATLTPDQRAAYSKAGQDFSSHNWANAFKEFGTLHEQVPANITIGEFLGEAALNLNKQPYTIELLRPIVQSSPNNWQAVALLARAYAETNQDASRDAEITALQAIHDGGHYPQLSKMQQFQLERHLMPEGGEIDIWYSLEPWGRFKAYLYARYTDAAGREQSYMTLESSDMDQIQWAKDHPKEAATGERLFSLDGYHVAVKNGDGSVTGFHATMGFYTGKPPYNLVRDRMLASVSKLAEPQKNLGMPADRSNQPLNPR